MKPSSSFVGITSEGGLLPTDFLSELLAPKSAIEGLTPTSYSLAEGEYLLLVIGVNFPHLTFRLCV